jgi:hypothetical protein
MEATVVLLLLHVGVTDCVVPFDKVAVAVYVCDEFVRRASAPAIASPETVGVVGVVDVGDEGESLLHPQTARDTNTRASRTV